jgi:hypothetical protein
MFQRGIEVVGERTGPKLLGKIRVSVAPEVEGDHVEVFGEAGGQVVPPVCVRPRAVDEDQLGSPGRAVVNAVEMNSIELRPGESLCASLHPARSVSQDRPHFPMREIAFHCSSCSSPQTATPPRAVEFGASSPFGRVFRLTSSLERLTFDAADHGVPSAGGFDAEELACWRG